MEHPPRVDHVCTAATHCGRGNLRHLSPREAVAVRSRGEPLRWLLERVAHLVRYALLQAGTWRRIYPGSFHAMIYWGFIVLAIATAVVMIDYDFGIPIMRGRFYLYFQSLFVDVMGLLAIVGISLAGYRRRTARPKLLVYTTEATAILLLIFTILVTGFLVEGWRIAVTDDPWDVLWSPVGNQFAKLSRSAMSIRP